MPCSLSPFATFRYEKLLILLTVFAPKQEPLRRAEAKVYKFFRIGTPFYNTATEVIGLVVGGGYGLRTVRTEFVSVAQESLRFKSFLFFPCSVCKHGLCSRDEFIFTYIYPDKESYFSVGPAKEIYCFIM